jgi:hypothetical protein
MTLSDDTLRSIERAALQGGLPLPQDIAVMARELVELRDAVAAMHECLVLLSSEKKFNAERAADIRSRGRLALRMAFPDKRTAPPMAFLTVVLRELERAQELHPQPINSVAEGYAVILEELDEFWDEVRKKQALRSKEQLRTELVEVAAMCLRTAIDCGLMETSK